MRRLRHCGPVKSVGARSSRIRLSVSPSKLDRHEEALAEFDITVGLVAEKDRPLIQSNRSALLVKMGRIDEAYVAFNDAFEAKPDVDSANTFAWAFYERNVGLDLAEEVALRGYKLNPSDINMIQTMAAIFVRREKWTDAVPVLEAWFNAVNIQDLKARWHQDAPLFCDALRIGRALDLADLVMRAAPADPMWSTIATALRMAVAEGAQSPPSNELGGLAQELARQFTGEVTDLRFPGSQVAAEEDH
jgi:tetratricopeptide (TPR) repeat protein